jgi:hypothetical protein
MQTILTDCGVMAYILTIFGLFVYGVFLLMKALFILNAPAYGSEQTYNALRLATALAKREHNDERIYLMGDAVVAAKRGQKVRLADWSEWADKVLVF